MFPRVTKSAVALAAVASMFALTACNSGDANAEKESGPVELKVLTSRTDLIEDGTFDGYAAEFNKKYPDVTVKFEGITDYEGEVKTRMSTENYGDVLNIPNNIQPNELKDFFEPLGQQEELSKQYSWLNDRSYDGVSYGIPTSANVHGFVYNKRIWKDAGITDWPTTPDEFINDLKAIKDKTKAIPYYTNYAAGWPLSQWESLRGVVSADADYNNKLVDMDDPWGAGKDHNAIDGLLFDIVANGLSEEDPTTTDWELSKDLIATGEVATMQLGSWSIVQMQDAATKMEADPADIGYLPFPVQVDGEFHTMVSGDYNLGINIHSSHKKEARDWIDWFTNESGFALSQGGLSPVIGSEEPAGMEEFLDIPQIVMNAPTAGKEGKVDEIDNQAEIGFWADIYRKRIVDAARGESGETKQEIFDDLNARWKEARATVMGG